MNYIVAKEGDTFESLAEIFCISARNLRKFNDLKGKAQPVRGEQIYIDRKLKRWGGQRPPSHRYRGRDRRVGGPELCAARKVAAQTQPTQSGRRAAHRPDAAHPVDGTFAGTDPTHAARAGNGSRGSPEGPARTARRIIYGKCEKNLIFNAKFLISQSDGPFTATSENPRNHRSQSSLKQQVFDNTFATFNELKDILFEMSSEWDDELDGRIDRRVRIEYRDRASSKRSSRWPATC